MRHQKVLPPPDAIYMKIDKSGDCESVLERKTVKFLHRLEGKPVFQEIYPKLVVEHYGPDPFTGEAIAEWEIDKDGKEIPGTRKQYQDKLPRMDRIIRFGE